MSPLPPDTVLWMAPGSVSRACRFVSRGGGGGWSLSPVNLVVATFCVNKAIQAVSFLGWWWLVSVVHDRHHDNDRRAVDVEAGRGQSDGCPLASFFSRVSSPSPLLSTTLLQLVIGAQLVIIGQTLNVAVYRAIGRDGVYYGGEGRCVFCK
jgi:hypothetical protein